MSADGGFLFTSESVTEGHPDQVAELDINPLICAGDRIPAVDAMFTKQPPPRLRNTGTACTAERYTLFTFTA